MAYDNAMVAHVWAQQTKEQGKSSNGNLWFRGATLYSYRTPIGRFTQSIDNQQIVLVTSDRFSMTTSSKHMPALWRALDYGRGLKVFRVPNVAQKIEWNHPDFVAGLSIEQHMENVVHLASIYTDYVTGLPRKRDLDDITEAGLVNALREMQEVVRDYVSAFGLSGVSLPDYCADASNLYIQISQRHTPEAKAKRKAEKDKRKAAKAEKEAQELALWRTGEKLYLGRTAPDGTAYLRVNGDMLQTSQGASVPLVDAIKVLKMVKLCREQGRAWVRNGHMLTVGHFTVDRIAENGDFVAGCHRIAWAEVEQAALAAGVADIKAEDTTRESA